MLSLILFSGLILVSVWVCVAKKKRLRSWSMKKVMEVKGREIRGARWKWFGLNVREVKDCQLKSKSALDPNIEPLTYRGDGARLDLTSACAQAKVRMAPKKGQTQEIGPIDQIKFRKRPRELRRGTRALSRSD